ncbi:gliding motility lipoprotein GldB [Negadavirga shengliensis]|uniref:Gliding motility lipoprotein GldB n=1 Tax=Negadavirga shengliensis TaxID=1389218 RepID=A0ABV9SUN4_9BACT
MKKIKYLPVVLFFLGVFACKKKPADCRLPDEILEIPLSIEIQRMEKNFFEDITEENIRYNLEAFSEFSKMYFEPMEYENKEELAAGLYQIHTDPGMQELYQEVMAHFPDMKDIEQELILAFKAIKYYYPQFDPPKVYTFVSGFGSDLVVTEDLIIIGLDYYLPADHRFQPLDLPEYIAKRYERDYLVPTLVTAISSRFNKTDLRDNTLLAEMIFYGKAYHFTKTILPCTPDEYIIGYETKEIVGSYANEQMIWAHFIENELLFETNPFEIRKYTGEAPFTDEISPDAPGRIGRWLGWNIVDDYRLNNDLSLQEVMDQQNAREIFKRSGYKPR